MFIIIKEFMNIDGRAVDTRTYIGPFDTREDAYKCFKDDNPWIIYRIELLERP